MLCGMFCIAGDLTDTVYKVILRQTVDYHCFRFFDACHVIKPMRTCAQQILELQTTGDKKAILTRVPIVRRDTSTLYAPWAPPTLAYLGTSLQEIDPFFPYPPTNLLTPSTTF